MDDKFKINVDGIEKEAESLDVVELYGKEYALYSVPVDSENSDILASEITKDENGNIKLIDIEEETVKVEILNIIKDTLATE